MMLCKRQKLLKESIFSGNELEETSVVKQYFTTAADGKGYQTKHYSLQASIPHSALIVDYAGIVSPLRAAVANHEQQTQELTALRDLLLPMLMNGQVSVTDAERAREVPA